VVVLIELCATVVFVKLLMGLMPERVEVACKFGQLVGMDGCIRSVRGHAGKRGGELQLYRLFDFRVSETPKWVCFHFQGRGRGQADGAFCYETRLDVTVVHAFSRDP
jgi:hypothetical protein